MWTLKILRFDQVPSDFREPFIISGYRSYHSSASSCLASAVQRTNETINFWTHFIPALIFALITWRVANGMDQGIDYGSARDHYTWPLVVFLLGACFYTTASAVAHMFNSMSPCARYVFFFIDYCGISIYSLGSCIAYYAYIFPPELMGTPLYHAYLPVAMVTALCSTYLACRSRFATWPPLRAAGRLPAFAIPYVWCSIPLVYRVIFCESTGCETQALSCHVQQFYWVLSIAFLYATRIPEVIAPGTFDFVGHSHQFFHIGSSVATYYQYRAFLAELKERTDFLNDHGGPTFETTFGVLLTVLLGNIVIVCLLSLHVIKLTRLKAAKSAKHKD